MGLSSSRKRKPLTSRPTRHRVLILNLYYPPDTGATAKIIGEVAESLAEGHEVTVLAGRPSYDPEEHHPYYLFRHRRQGPVTVERVGSTAFNRRRMAGRLANYFSYMGMALARLLTVRPAPDLVISMTDPPMAAFLAAVAKKIRSIPFVYNIRDLHPDVAVHAGVIAPSMLVRLWARTHEWALRLADIVVVLGQDMSRRVIEKGVDPGRVVVVRDGAPPVEPANSQHPVAQQIRNGFPFVVLHAGNLGFAGAFGVILEAAKSLMDDQVGFVFVGDGATKARLEEQAVDCPNVRFEHFRPAAEISYVMGAGDLHVVCLRRGLEGLVVPSKLYTTLAAGRPVLAVAPEESDVAQIVREHECGIVADPDNPASVAECIRWAVAHQDLLAIMGQRAKVAADAFSRERELKRFADVIDRRWNHGSEVSPGPADV